MVASEQSLSQLVDLIRGNIPEPAAAIRPLLEGLFGERYQKRHFAPTIVRDAYSLAAGDAEDGVPYAGLIHPDNPTSGPYGGTSVVWFPTRDAGSLMGFGVGTRGLAPDEGILTRPGHRRRIAALRSVLSKGGIEAWSKPDPAALGVAIPKVTQDRFPGFQKTFQRYGHEMYCIAKVPSDPEKARVVVAAFLDLYAYERNWQVLKAAESEAEALQSSLREGLFPAVDPVEVHRLLRRSRHDSSVPSGCHIRGLRSGSLAGPDAGQSSIRRPSRMAAPSCALGERAAVPPRDRRSQSSRSRQGARRSDLSFRGRRDRLANGEAASSGKRRGVASAARESIRARHDEHRRPEHRGHGPRRETPIRVRHANAGSKRR